MEAIIVNAKTRNPLSVLLDFFKRRKKKNTPSNSENLNGAGGFPGPSTGVEPGGFSEQFFYQSEKDKHVLEQARYEAQILGLKPWM